MKELIGKKVRDIETGKIEIIKDATDSSVLITRTKLSEAGINCDNWFEKQKFYKSFEII